MKIGKVYTLWIALGVVLSGYACHGQDLPAQIKHCEAMTREHPADGNAWYQLAVLDQDAGRYVEADIAYRTASELLKPADTLSYATTLDRWGTMYAERGRYAEAENVEREALALRGAAGDAHGEGLSWMHLAMLALGRHELKPADRYAGMAVSRLAPEREHLDTPASATLATPEEKMAALEYFALVRFAEGKYKDAMPELRLARAYARESHGEGSFPDAFLGFLLGKAYWKSGDTIHASALMKAGLDGVESQLGWGHATYISMLREYELFLRENGRTVEAAEMEAKRVRLVATQDRDAEVMAQNEAR